MSDGELARYLEKPLTPADPDVLAAIQAGPIDPSEALPRAEVDRLLDPAPMESETGWCVLPDGVAYVAVRTEMPGVTGEALDWWFDWHPRDPDRYRAWHPLAHESNSVELPDSPGAKKHWGTVHHPVEDVGTGMEHARIAFVPPSEFGFSTDALEDPAVATIVCGWVGDDRRRMQHSSMAHVWLNDGDGTVLRSRFWMGDSIRPRLPGPLGDLAGAALNRKAVRTRVMPERLPQALANHCAEEYTNLAAILPEIHARYGGTE